MALGFVVIAYEVQTQFRREGGRPASSTRSRSSGRCGRSATTTATPSRPSSTSWPARRPRSSRPRCGPEAMALARRFELTERQLEVLERAAEALERRPAPAATAGGPGRGRAPGQRHPGRGGGAGRVRTVIGRRVRSGPGRRCACSATACWCPPPGPSTSGLDGRGGRSARREDGRTLVVAAAGQGSGGGGARGRGRRAAAGPPDRADRRDPGHPGGADPRERPPLPTSSTTCSAATSRPMSSPPWWPTPTGRPSAAPSPRSRSCMADVVGFTAYAERSTSRGRGHHAQHLLLRGRARDP